MPFVGEGPQRFLEDDQVADLDAELALAGRHHHSLGAEPVPKIDSFEQVGNFVTRIGPIDEQLDRAALIAKGAELELAERTVQHQSAGDRDRDICLLTRAEICEPLLQGCRQVGALEPVRVAAGVEDRLMTLPALRSLGVRLLFDVVGHRGR